MHTSNITYLGNLRTKAVHLRSGSEIVTDAPVDNQGKGEAFSPTDLAATSLGCCMLTIMGISAQSHGFNLEGTEIKVTKIMGAEPRKISEVVLEINFPENYSDKVKAILKYITETCPVALSLHPDLKQTIIINYP